MADPITIGGFIYPIAKDLIELVKKLSEVYEGVRYAKRNFKRVMDKTEVVAGTYVFFKQTIEDVKKVKTVARIFVHHGDLVRKVEDESKRILDRLKGIKGIFWFLESGNLVSLTDQWIGHYQWYRESKKTIPGLFQDMEVLESSMRTIGILVNTHILLHVSKSGGSGQLRARINSFTMVLNIELQKLEHAGSGNLQHRVSSTGRPERTSFAQQVVQILNEEIPRLQHQRQSPSASTSDSRSTISSRESNQPSPITPPLTPPGPSNEGRADDVKPKEKIPSQKVRRRRITLKSPEQNLVSSPSSLFLASETEAINQDQKNAEQVIHEQDQDRQEDEHIQMPPVAPPESSPRYPPNTPQDRHDQRKNNSQYQGPYHSTWKRRKNGSKISVYANDGETTPWPITKMMARGIPVQDRKGKIREK